MIPHGVSVEIQERIENWRCGASSVCLVTMQEH